MRFLLHSREEQASDDRELVEKVSLACAAATGCCCACSKSDYQHFHTNNNNAFQGFEEWVRSAIDSLQLPLDPEFLQELSPRWYLKASLSSNNNNSSNSKKILCSGTNTMSRQASDHLLDASHHSSS
jgi:hypothetical protein